MNTPKTFEPAVPMPELPFSPYLVSQWAGPDMVDHKVWTAYSAEQVHAYAREYAGLVARSVVPSEQYGRQTPVDSTQWCHGYNACRAATLSAIDEWEKNV